MKGLIDKVCLIERLKSEWSPSSHCLGLNFKHGLTEVSLAPLDCCLGDGARLESPRPANELQPILTKCGLSQRIHSLKEFFKNIGPLRQADLKKTFDVSLSATDAQSVLKERAQRFCLPSGPKSFPKGRLVQLKSSNDFTDIHLFVSAIWHNGYRVFVLDLENIQPNQSWTHKYWLEEIEQNQLSRTMFVVMGVDSYLAWHKKAILEHVIDFCHGTGSMFWLVLNPNRKNSLVRGSANKGAQKLASDPFKSPEVISDLSSKPSAKNSFHTQLMNRDQKQKSETSILTQIPPGSLAKLKDMCEIYS